MVKPHSYYILKLSSQLILKAICSTCLDQICTIFSDEESNNGIPEIVLFILPQVCYCLFFNKSPSSQYQKVGNT